MVLWEKIWDRTFRVLGLSHGVRAVGPPAKPGAFAAAARARRLHHLLVYERFCRSCRVVIVTNPNLFHIGFVGNHICIRHLSESSSSPFYTITIVWRFEGRPPKSYFLLAVYVLVNAAL